MRHLRGQSLAEYTVLVIIVLAVLLTMNQYLKRGIQGRWKTSVDQMGDQYDPRVANSHVLYKTSSYSNTAVRVSPDVGGSWTQRIDTTNSIDTQMEDTTIGSTKPN